jgi:hypothetical protein
VHHGLIDRYAHGHYGNAANWENSAKPTHADGHDNRPWPKTTARGWQQRPLQGEVPVQRPSYESRLGLMGTLPGGGAHLVSLYRDSDRSISSAS